MKHGFRYVALEMDEKIGSIEVPTQVHWLLSPGESPLPTAKFWNLTFGGEQLETKDEKCMAYLLSAAIVKSMADGLQEQTWEALEDRAKLSCDMMPGWHKGLQPHFEALRAFFSAARDMGIAVIRMMAK